MTVTKSFQITSDDIINIINIHCLGTLSRSQANQHASDHPSPALTLLSLINNTMTLTPIHSWPYSDDQSHQGALAAKNLEVVSKQCSSALLLGTAVSHSQVSLFCRREGDLEKITVGEKIVSAISSRDCTLLILFSVLSGKKRKKTF